MYFATLGKIYEVGKGRCSTEGYGVEVHNVTLPMATVVFLLVHLEIGDQDVFVVTERVVECHRALIVGGARRLRGGEYFMAKGFKVTFCRIY